MHTEAILDELNTCSKSCCTINQNFGQTEEFFVTQFTPLAMQLGVMLRAAPPSEKFPASAALLAARTKQ